jgi:hypothetical protein
MKSIHARTTAVAVTAVCALLSTALPGWSKPKCPLSYGATDLAKSHKLFLYFPAMDDSTFPPFDAHVSPAKRFDVADLDPAIGTTPDLESRIQEIVIDDYCEFNVQVLKTDVNPEQLGSPPPNRRNIAIGSDADALVTGRWGQAPPIVGDLNDVDFARVWAGTYVNCEGGDGSGSPFGCSNTGALTGVNSTLEHWAQAIGGTAAHEAGHTYGLVHSDEDPPTGNCKELGPPPLLGEDGYERHLMPNGCNLDGLDRTTYRRHFGDRTFGILAKNVGLSIQTMHNWDMINPNAATATRLEIDFLSPKKTVAVDWTWTGASSPWADPQVKLLSSTAVTFQGKSFFRFRITWSDPNSASPTPGKLPGGEKFHVGATFTGVDFNQPDPIIIQDVTLFDSGSKALTLHPRLPSYDTGTVAADGSYLVHFYPQLSGTKLELQDAVIYQLPRVASIESMIGDGKPLTFAGEPIVPWTESRCEVAREDGTVICGLGNIADRPHVEVTRNVGDPGVYDCSQGPPKPEFQTARDAPGEDIEGLVCAGTVRDPFPSATVYVIATFVDPEAEHWDPREQRMVSGPVVSKVFYQFAGVRDLRRLTDGAAPKR